MRILIAEDDPVSNQLLTQTLTRWEYEVVSVDNGDAAWSCLRGDAPPQLVILDWMMPGMSGVDICRNLRETENGRYTYILLLTGKTDKDDVVAGLEAGADDFLTKPFNPHELQVRLKAGERILALENDLLESLSQLKESEELRRNFVSALTHDLRTPLIAEGRALELIASHPEELTQRVEALVRGLTKNNADLQSMVNQLLETFRLESGTLVLDREPVDFNALARDVFFSLEALAQTKRIRLKNTLPEDFVTASGDFQQLKRVMTNLIGNAINNIPADCQVEILGEDLGDFVRIRVRDNGHGIPLDLQPHLFERYFSGQKRTRDLSTGLGLSICKSIIVSHGGQVAVDSTPGKGTSFTFTLPKSAATVEAVQHPELETPLRVVIVEDQELARFGLKLSLEALGNVEVLGMAGNGEEAIGLVMRQMPDVVIMDIVMPVMDGITATQKLKNLYPQLKVVMLTSQTHEREVYAAMAAGADGYCIKDIKPHRLMDALLNVTAGNRWLDPVIAAIVERALPYSENHAPDLHESAQNKTYQEARGIANPGEYYETELTDREVQIIRLIAAGNSNKDVAGVLYETPEKINDYLVSIFRKLAVDSKTEAAAKAVQMGLLKLR